VRLFDGEIRYSRQISGFRWGVTVRARSLDRSNRLRRGFSIDDDEVTRVCEILLDESWIPLSIPHSSASILSSFAAALFVSLSARTIISSSLMLDFCNVERLTRLFRLYVTRWRVETESQIASLVLRFFYQINIVNGVKVCSNQGRSYRASRFQDIFFGAFLQESALRAFVSLQWRFLC